MDSKLFSAARRASGITVEKAAEACGVSRPTFNARERNPLDFRLSELKLLYSGLDETGRRLLLEAITSVFTEEDQQ